MALALTPSLEAARQAVALTVAGISGTAATMTVERVGPSGTVAGVRGAVGVDVTGATSRVVRDYEAPLDVPLTYTVRTYNAGGALLATATATYTLDADPSDDPWLVDLAYPTNSQRVKLESLASATYGVVVGVHRVLNRRAPVLTSAPAGTPSSDLVFVTLDDVARERTRGTLGTGVPVLLRTHPAQGIGNAYLGVTGYRQERASRVAFYGERRWRCEVVQVDRPDPSIFTPLPPMTYAALKTTYASYADVLAAGTYDDVIYQFDAGGGEVAYAIPWPAGDV